MSKINRRSFLGLLKLAPLVPLVAKLPPAPVVEQVAETASAEGGYLMPYYIAEQLLDAQQRGHNFWVSQELLDDDIAFRGVMETFAKELQTGLIQP